MLERKRALVNRTFKIPDEEPFIFGAIFPKTYATEIELQRGIKFFPTQFHSRLTDSGIEVYLLGFTGKRFVSWFLVEKVLSLIRPNGKMIEIAKEQKIKEKEPKLSYSLKTNRERFNQFKKKGTEILKLRMSVFES